MRVVSGIRSSAFTASIPYVSVHFKCSFSHSDPLKQIDTVTLTWAIHSLSGISSPANAMYSEEELLYQLKSSGAKAIFTCFPLLKTSIAAAAKCGIPENRIYLLPLPKALVGEEVSPPEFRTVNDLIKDGQSLPQVEKLRWNKGDGATKTALLCYSSGTSGLPVSRHRAQRYGQLTAMQERSDDLPPQCHSKCSPNIDL